jgi:hypothetical protein
MGLWWYNTGREGRRECGRVKLSMVGVVAVGLGAFHFGAGSRVSSMCVMNEATVGARVLGSRRDLGPPRVRWDRTERVSGEFDGVLQDRQHAIASRGGLDTLRASPSLFGTLRSQEESGRRDAEEHYPDTIRTRNGRSMQ